MVEKNEEKGCCGPADADNSCCKVESIVTVDERGQMVLPKEIREKAKIKAGDKLAIIGWEAGGEICCLSLMKADELKSVVTEKLGPVIKVIMKKERKEKE